MDPVARSAARVATLIAIPIAVIVGGWILASAGVFSGGSPQASSPVTMAAPALDPAAMEVCRSVVAKLPEVAADRHRRPVNGGPEQNAAYGEPPVTLSCGAPVPAFPPTADVYLVGGVCWIAEVRSPGSVWTTVDRTVPVAVTVPGAADGSSQSVIPFSAAIAENDPARANPPTGCL